MSHPHTRKSFLAKLLAAFAVGGAAPKLLANSAPSAAASAPSAGASPAVKVQPDNRAVARAADSV